MASTYSAYAYYVNGWCGGCGRKRDRDGSCSNCDHWYTSPLLIAGGPLLLATLTLLYVGISALRPEARPATSLSVLSTSPVAATAGAPRSLPSVQRPLPTASLPAASLALPGYNYQYTAPPVDERILRAQAQMLQMENLRSAVAYTDSTIRADDAVRAQQEQSVAATHVRNFGNATHSNASRGVW